MGTQTPGESSTSSTSSAEETSGQEQQGQQQQATPEAGANGTQQQAPVIDKSTKLPDDHPLVTAHSTVKEKLATANTELAEARSQAAKATQLQAELDKRPTPEALATLQTRYERLEAFAQAVGLGKALDSRTFTRDLFESDKDIKSLVTEWQRANPTATSQALSSAGGTGGGKVKHDPNELLRIAAGKA